MRQLNELYQSMILDHNKKPRNFGRLSKPSHTAEGMNPLCGDHYWVDIEVDGEKIKEISFEGSGCAISKASASLMTTTLKNKSISEAFGIFEEFHSLLLGKSDLQLGKLQVFEGIWKYPSRVKCASLCWHALKSALGNGATATTE